ncbi:hypothetical protein NQZ68_026368 [Dissostichus eleginoides]|nr:hypothetical protein NQZ68_026368 [Dissostichus eleginoides]
MCRAEDPSERQEASLSVGATMTELVAKWPCEYCTYENWLSAIKCTMCRAQRPSGGAIITEEPLKSSPPLEASLHQWDPAGLSNSPTQGGSLTLKLF